MKILCRLLAGCSMVLALAGSLYAGESQPLVMFDQGHNQKFVIEEKGELQLSKLADTVAAAGVTVTAGKEKLTDEVLKGVTGLVISGPFQELGKDEIDAVERFIKRGGRLAVMLHIGPPLAGLLSRLDVDHSNAVMHERSNVIDADINFRITTLTSSPLFNGVSHFSMYGAWALDPGASATALASTSPQAWADLDGNRVLSRGDAIGAFTVAVQGTLGSGGFVVFGDDAMFQNRYLDEQNGRLAANLAGWLAGR